MSSELFIETFFYSLKSLTLEQQADSNRQVMKGPSQSRKQGQNSKNYIIFQLLLIGGLKSLI